MQPSAQKHPERLGIQTGGLRRWEGGQRNRSQRTTLGTDQCPGAVTQGRPHPLADELVLQCLGCLLLPAELGQVRLWFLVVGRWAVCQLLPVRHLQSCLEDCLLALSD